MCVRRSVGLRRQLRSPPDQHHRLQASGAAAVTSGWSVASAGEDFNGDGFAGVMVGAPHANGDTGPNSGKTYVVFSRAGASPPISTSRPRTAAPASGWTVSGTRVRLVGRGGDLNGDGYTADHRRQGSSNTSVRPVSIQQGLILCSRAGWRPGPYQFGPLLWGWQAATGPAGRRSGQHQQRRPGRPGRQRYADPGWEPARPMSCSARRPPTCQLNGSNGQIVSAAVTAAACPIASAETSTATASTTSRQRG